MIRVSLNESKLEDVLFHLEFMDKHFRPNLSSYTDINTYAETIDKKSIKIEIWLQKQLVGLIAGYCSKNNDFFISNYSAFPSLRHQGIALLLLKHLEDYSCENIIQSLILEVYKVNERAVAFYEKNGFKQFKNTKNTFFMKKSL
jgi:ribosomal protein S18 acetylase RimI-like enzyme